MSGDDEFSGASLLVSSSENEFSSLQTVSESIKTISSKLSNISEEIEEVKDMITTEISVLDFDENERELVEERLDLLFKLSMKYGEKEQDMLDFLEDAKKKRDSILYNDDELEKLNLEYDECYEIVVDLAAKLSNYRKEVAKQFEKNVKEQLVFLDMPKIEFIVDFQTGKLTSNGYDKIEFLISTNPGEPPKPLSKIASGGELSRIMLAIKNIIAHNDTIGTLIFDEIDTGVSGRASRKIGLKLKSLSKDTQVITVTHSAQIASVADVQFLIQKDFENNKAYTKVTPLDFEGRKRELARIMGGLEITDSLLKSAEELLLSQEDI